MKSYTDLKQSKKLAEFLPIESADMTWEQVAHNLTEDFTWEPVYKEWKGGILNLIKLQEEKEPDYYKYYKQIGTKRIILVGSQIIDYLNKRGINYGSN